MQAPPPAGVIRPNAKALSLGLSFAQAFQNGPSFPWIARGGIASAVNSIKSGGTNMLGGVPSMAGNGAYWGGLSAGNTYALPQTQGTVIAAVVADHAAGDGVAHTILDFGNGAFPAGPMFQFQKWTSNSMFAGWVSTSDKRIGYAVTGLYSAGDSFTLANTWNAAGQVAYLKGVARGSNASTGFGNTSGQHMVIGQNWATTQKWSNGVAGGVLYVLVFDQALTPAQIAEAEADFWWWARQPAWRREVAGPIPPTPSITGGGSIVTMPPDFGYPQSLTRGPPNPAMSV